MVFRLVLTVVLWGVPKRTEAPSNETDEEDKKNKNTQKKGRESIEKVPGNFVQKLRRFK